MRRRRSTRLDRWFVPALHALEYAALMVLRGIVLPLPPDRRIGFGGFLGRLIVPNLPATRRRVERNLARALPALPAAERRRIAVAVGDNFGRVLAEYECLDRIARDPARVTVAGPGLAALAEGRGAVIVSAHFGNWEAIRFALLQRGRPVAMIYRDFNNPLFDRDVRAKMDHAGKPVLPKGREGMRALVGHLARGGTALILVDQKQSRAPLLPFLGLPAETVPVAAELAGRWNLPLVPAFATRQPDGLRFHVEFEAPIPPGDPLARMAEVNARIGARIAAMPGQWFWLHNRWRA